MFNRAEKLFCKTLYVFYVGTASFYRIRTITWADIWYLNILISLRMSQVVLELVSYFDN
jgi:hypothetical protein